MAPIIFFATSKKNTYFCGRYGILCSEESDATTGFKRESGEIPEQYPLL